MKLLIFAMLFNSTITMASSKIKVTEALIRLPPPGSNTSVLFLKITNNEQSDRALVSVSGSISENFELHEMAMDGGKMTMRNVDKIPLKKGETTVLKSGGPHVMIFNLKKVLKENERVEIQLMLDKQERLTAKATVKKPN